MQLMVDNTIMNSPTGWKVVQTDIKMGQFCHNRTGSAVAVRQGAYQQRGLHEDSTRTGQGVGDIRDGFSQSIVNCSLTQMAYTT